MIQKGEAYCEIEIAQLAEEDLGVSLAPHDHSLLPNEVLGHIFILLALSHGTVQFPIQKNDGPPQLVISHSVCSHWVALCTTELWSDARLFCPTDDSHFIGLHQEWLIRAGTLPVTLSIVNRDAQYLKPRYQTFLNFISTFGLVMNVMMSS